MPLTERKEEKEKERKMKEKEVRKVSVPSINRFSFVQENSFTDEMIDKQKKMVKEGENEERKRKKRRKEEKERKEKKEKIPPLELQSLNTILIQYSIS